MAVDTFLVFAKKSGNNVEIKGETSDETYSKKGGVAVLSWSFGASNPTTIGSNTTGSAAGKVSIGSLNIMKDADKSSPMFFLATCNGAHFTDGVTLECRKSGSSDGKAENKPFLIYEMTGVFVESFQVSASSEVPNESISLVFESIVMKYAPQKPDGSLDTPIPAGWDVKTNKAKA